MTHLVCSGFCWWYRCQLHANTLINASSSVGSSLESPQAAVFLSPRSGWVVQHCFSFLLAILGYSQSAGAHNLIRLGSLFAQYHAITYGRHQIYPWISAVMIHTSLIPQFMSGNGRIIMSRHSCLGESQDRLFCQLDVMVPVNLCDGLLSALFESVCSTYIVHLRFLSS
jgi:hypothetical protein